MKPPARVYPGGRYATEKGDMVVFEVLPVGAGYQVRGIERVRCDLAPSLVRVFRTAHERFCARVGVR